MSSTYLMERTYFHLLGKTGTGKSSTGNTILGRKIFNAKSSLSAVTTRVESEQTRIGQDLVEVVDGPGLVLENGDINYDALYGFTRIVRQQVNGRHVFLLVCRYGARFSPEDRAAVNALRLELGEKVFNQNAIIVVTCGDNFAVDTDGEGLTFKTWCSQQTGDFAHLIRSVNDRVLLVDNVKGNRSNFHSNLMKTVDALGAHHAKDRSCWRAFLRFLGLSGGR